MFHSQIDKNQKWRLKLREKDEKRNGGLTEADKIRCDIEKAKKVVEKIHPDVFFYF